MKNKGLFSEFEQVSAKQWKQKIQYDLKGADYNESLVWESPEGINVKPFYHSEDVKRKTGFSLNKNHSWHIGQFIYVANAEAANKKALDVLSRGAQHLVFQIPDASVDLEKLLDEINLGTIQIYFEFGFLDADYIEKLINFLSLRKAKAFLNIDLVGNLARSGNWFYNSKKDHELLNDIFSMSTKNDQITCFGVDTALYQNAGANGIQQLAYGLAQANEYLNHVNNVSSDMVEKASPFLFKAAIGPNYFFEIAKLRALRLLWRTLTAEYGMATDCHILTLPSKRNKTLYDYNVNMLRTSTECMAAILGGADTVCNLPYDAIYHKDNEFGERIARNQLLLLKEESYFDEAVHAAEGNYYIETLTDQLAEKALVLFKQIEAGGGFLKQLKEGKIQQKIKESAEKEQALFDDGHSVLVGSNKFENKKERMKDNLELYPFVKTEKRQTLIEPILEKRLAEGLEK